MSTASWLKIREEFEKKRENGQMKQVDDRAVFPVFVGRPTYLSWLLAELMISSLILISQWVKQLVRVHMHSDALYYQVCKLDKVFKRLDTSNLPIILFLHHHQRFWDGYFETQVCLQHLIIQQNICCRSVLGVTSASKDFLPYKFIFDTYLMYLPLSTAPRKLAFYMK